VLDCHHAHCKLLFLLDDGVLLLGGVSSSCVSSKIWCCLWYGFFGGGGVSFGLPKLNVKLSVVLQNDAVGLFFLLKKKK